jgi:hypothetical protein
MASCTAVEPVAVSGAGRPNEVPSAQACFVPGWLPLGPPPQIRGNPCAGRAAPLTAQSATAEELVVADGRSSSRRGSRSGSRVRNLASGPSVRHWTFALN